MKENILITGVAGFIGFNLAKKFLKNNYKIYGIDNINNYYDPKLKNDRLKILKNNKYFFFKKIDLKQFKSLDNYIKKNKINFIIHLAAQAGVRYSIINPQTYIDNNITGFLNILEIMKKNKIKKIIYASSSSVYGNTNKKIFSEKLDTSSQINIYAVTKKTNELMAHAYHNLYKINSIGLRFFTVYGPYGRPDMSLNIFANGIKNKRKFNLFNRGKMIRDFTYIDDVVLSVFKLFKKFSKSNKNYYDIFNVGTSKPVKLTKYVQLIAHNLNRKPKMILSDLQKGDVKSTISNSNRLYKYVNFKPITTVEEGIKKFVNWFNDYYK